MTTVPFPLLDVRALDVAYGAVRVLEGIDLRVAPGETVALLGTNGAGKSTLLRAISGVLKPRAGTVAFDGQDITSMPSAVSRTRYESYNWIAFMGPDGDSAR